METKNGQLQTARRQRQDRIGRDRTGTRDKGECAETKTRCRKLPPKPACFVYFARQILRQRMRISETSYYTDRALGHAALPTSDKKNTHTKQRPSLPSVGGKVLTAENSLCSATKNVRRNLVYLIDVTLSLSCFSAGERLSVMTTASSAATRPRGVTERDNGRPCGRFVERMIYKQ